MSMQTVDLEYRSEEGGNVTTAEREAVHIKESRGYLVLKRGMDIIASLLALAVLAIPIAILAVVIVLDSPGASPFYVQKRIGKDGKPFNFIKLRSMVPHAEEKLNELLQYNEVDGPAFKIKEDPRITRIGRFIRKTSIDELPQLLNVLVGDMSIVGPRPPLPREVEQYDDYQRQRLSVTPGLTCYWQVQPHRNDISFDDWVELDLKYIRERSFWLDCKLILQTVGVVLRMQGE